MDFLIRLQKIDRRWVYLFVFVACTVPFVLAQTKYKIALPVYESPEARDVYDVVDKCPPNKVVMVDSSWDAGSMGENRGQVEVVFDHMLRNHTKFIVTAQNCPLGPQFSQEVLDKLVAEKYPNAKYGVDYVNLGVVIGADWQIMSQIAKDIRRVYPKDVKGTLVDQIPVMKNVHNINDIYMIHAVTYSPSENWLAFIYGPYRTPITFGCAGIQSTTYYRYVSSGQLKGMLVGIRGAAEYDAMLYPTDLSKRRSLGTKLIVPLSFGHLVVIIAIIVGNIGFFAAQKRRA
jgi:hypothetical protein